MSNILAFSFEKSPVRTFNINNEIWFCASDVCDVLGYANHRKSLRDHCKTKGVTKRYTPTLGGNQELTYINEPNLYRLIIRSKKPEAERFESWVVEEVLPEIRKTGSYRKSLSYEQVSIIKNMMSAGCFKLLGNSAARWLVNNVRVKYNVDRIEDIPADQYDDVCLFLKEKRDDACKFITMRHELTRLFCKDILGGSTTWTPAIKRRMTDEVKRQTYMTGKINWLQLK